MLILDRVDMAAGVTSRCWSAGDGHDRLQFGVIGGPLERGSGACWALRGWDLLVTQLGIQRGDRIVDLLVGAFVDWFETLAAYIRVNHGLGEALHTAAIQNAVNATYAPVTAAVAR